jgi:hypothetical protein
MNSLHYHDQRRTIDDKKFLGIPRAANRHSSSKAGNPLLFWAKFGTPFRVSAIVKLSNIHTRTTLSHSNRSKKSSIFVRSLIALYLFPALFFRGRPDGTPLFDRCWSTFFVGDLKEKLNLQHALSFTLVDGDQTQILVRHYQVTHSRE